MTWSKSRPPSNRRRYDYRHQQERARLTPHVQAGHAYCQQGLPGNGSSGTCINPAGRWIKPGTTWVLGHTDDRTAWIGPVHQPCNARDAAIRGNQASKHKHPKQERQRPWRSRTW